MSDERVPDARISVSLHQKNGKKTTKIHLYLASQFRSAWSPEIRKQFQPPVPLQNSKHDEYWGQPHYRVMIDGKWAWVGVRYTFYTLDAIMEKVKGVLDEQQ